MTINPAWTNADTVALKSKVLAVSEMGLKMQEEMDAIERIVARNAITSEELTGPLDEGGPVPKSAIWEILTFRDQYAILLGNGTTITAPSFWDGVMGRMTKV